MASKVEGQGESQPLAPAGNGREQGLPVNREPQIERYLKTVSAQLGAATVSEREKIAGEIAAHIRKWLENQGESVESVLARLGPPEGLGERYRELLMTRQASRSFWPTELLMASFRRGILGILAGLLGLAGYWLGGIRLVFGGLALFWDAMYGAGHRPLPIGSSFSNIFEIIGSGLFFLLFSTMLLRTALRLLLRSQSPL